MSFLSKSGMRNSKMKRKPEPEVVLRTILAKTKFLGFLGLVYGWYVYVRRQRDQPFDRSTGDVLDRRRGPETELLRPGELTPITLSVYQVSVLESTRSIVNAFKYRLDKNESIHRASPVYRLIYIFIYYLYILYIYYIYLLIYTIYTFTGYTQG